MSPIPFCEVNKRRVKRNSSRHLRFVRGGGFLAHGLLKTPDADFLDGLLHRTEDELNRFENSDLIEVTPTGKVNAYGYPIKNYKVKWNRSQKAEWNRLERRYK